MTKKISWSKALWIAIGTYTFLFTALSFWKYAILGYTAWDLGIYHNVLYNTINGNFLYSSIQSSHYFGDHFEPLLLFFIPFFKLFPSPLLLLFFQSAILGLTAWPIFKLAKIHLRESWGFVAAILWLVNPFVWNINFFEFHIIAFAPFFIFWTLVFFEKKNFFLFLFFLLFSLIIREDVALALIPLSLIAFWEKRKIYWILAPIFFGSISFFGALAVIHFFSGSHSYKFWYYYEWLGATPFEWIKNISLHPWKFLSHIVNLRHIGIIFVLTLPLWLLPLKKPRYLLLGILPFFQLAFMKTGVPETTLYLQYTSLLLPALFWAFILSLASILNQKKTYSFRWIFKEHQPIFFGILFFSISVYAFFLLGPIRGIILGLSENKEKLKLLGSQKALLENIPSEASVATTENLLPYLSGRKNLYSLRYLFFEKKQFNLENFSLQEPPLYLIFDISETSFYSLVHQQDPSSLGAYRNGIERMHRLFEEENYGVVRKVGTLVLLEKKKPFQRLTSVSQKAPKITYMNHLFGKELMLLGYNLKKENELIHLELVWNATRKIKDDIFIKIDFKNNKEKIVYEEYYPLGYIENPTSLWSPRDFITTNHEFSLPLQMPSETINSMSIEIFRGKGIRIIDVFRRAKLVILQKKILGKTFLLHINQ